MAMGNAKGIQQVGYKTMSMCIWIITVQRMCMDQYIIDFCMQLYTVKPSTI